MDERAISVGGVRFDIGVPTFRWNNPKGFNGYTTERCEIKVEDRKTGNVTTKVIKGKRYSKRPGDSLAGISQIMIHHSGGDGKNPSGMFETLWRQRGLSVHFAVEDDGRIFQFLDAGVKAWHGGSSNDISVGIECCLVPSADDHPDAYNEANRKRTGNLPHDRRPEVLQGVRRTVYVMPAPQVEALARLCAGLWSAIRWFANGGDTKSVNADVARKFSASPKFPRVLGAPSGDDIPSCVVSAPTQHVGLIGHLHYTDQKWDPAGLSWYALEQLVAARCSDFRAATEV
jgi:hypothetical protein